MARRGTTDSEIRETAAVYDPDPGVPAAGLPPVGLPAGEEPQYGSRWVKVRGADGSMGWRQVALAWEDLFDPQEGDVMVHSTLHGRIIRRTAEMLEHWFKVQGRGDVLITDDVKMLWGIPGLDDIGPDVAVIFDVRDPSRPRGSFGVIEEGTRPSLVIEVISKSTRKFDYESKPEIYQRAGVGECFFVDPLKEPWTLSGQRFGGAGGSYLPVELDAGWLASETTGLRFRIGENGASLVIEDSASGERLRNLSEEAVARRAAELEAEREQAAREQEAAAREQEAAARAQAERRAAQEAAARKQEAGAREQAERRAAQAAAARAQAERQAARLAAEKQALEEQVARLEEQLGRGGSEDQDPDG